MGTKYTFLFTFLIVQVLCEQKNSLTFVIDGTSSMDDEIYQVKRAAKSIIDIVLNEKSSQIEDIVVVTFNDPTVAFRHRTRDEVELKKTLDGIKVHSGGDCPEMSLSGIKVALEESRPGSYLFVFTDASAKDYNKFEEIKALCQEKQSQIVFVLTGDCGRIPTINSHVYYKIAAASNGQVFRISKGEIRQVLEYVKEMIKGDKTVITSKVVPPYTWSTVLFNIDDKTEYALVTASGSNAQLMVQNQFSGNLKYIPVIWTKNVKSLKLIGLRPGVYKALVYGSSDVSVMIFGRTDFNFNFGFSNKVENSLKFTEAQPTKGTKTHLIISVKDDEHSVNIKNVEILDMNERVIQLLPLTDKGGNVYATNKFLPPNSMFKIAVTATARSTGKPIRRIAKTPVAPIQPVVVAPEISDTEKILTAKEGETGNIHCRIRQGKPKPHVSWYFKQRGAKDFKLIQGKTDDVLLKRNVVVSDTGEYQCVAANIAGQVSHTVQLEVFELPAFEKSPSVLEIRQSANVDIQCKISNGNPPPKITWQFKSPEVGEFRDIDNAGEHLRIVNVQLGNSGSYKCHAKNDLGTAEQVIEVIVLVNPEFEDTPAKITEKESASVTLKCKLRKGNPSPRITWYFQASDSAAFTIIGNSGEELRLPAVQLKDSGEYKCVAKNSAGRHEKTTGVTILAAPEIERSTPSIMTVKENATVSIPCRVVNGVPKPDVTWWYMDTHSTEYVAIPNSNEGYLRLEHIQLSNAGHYKCVARNLVGQADKDVQIIVEGPPAFEKSPSVLEVRQSANANIQCKISKGNPSPTITWQFKSPEVGEFRDIDNAGEHLRIVNVQLGNSGSYKCHAKNDLGTVEQLIEVIVLVNPEFEDTPAKITEKESAPVTLNCKLRKGNPSPRITWYFQASGSAAFTIIGNSGEELRHPAVQLKDSGEYKCVAKNGAGRDEKTTVVTVLAAPEIERITPSIMTVKENATVSIPCRVVNGVPKPDVTWWYMDTHSTEYVAIPNSNEGYLRFEHIQLSNAGHYKCVARNLVGQADKDVQIIVEGPPAFEKSPSVLEVRQSANANIQCKISKGSPPPKITWQFKSPEVGEFRDIDNAGEHLRIANVQLSNSGSYKCHAKNNLGTVEQLIEVIVLVNPEFEDTPAKITEKESAPVTLKCKLRKGNPSPRITWYFQASGSAAFTIIGNSGEELRLPAVQLKDSGEYKCVAKNSAGRDEKTTVVTVLASPEIERSTPSIMTVKENATVSIPCRVVNGVPKPDVTWWYMDTHLTDYVAIPNSNEGYLHLEHIQLSNAGHYKCVARNSVGQADKDVQVVVKGPPAFEKSPSVLEVRQSVNVDIQCKISKGNPPPTITWQFKSSEVGEFRDIDNAGEHLRIVNVQLSKSGSYKCHAKNDLGTAEQVIEVIVLVNPEIEDTLTKITEKVNAPVTLKCKLRKGNPYPRITWYFQARGSATYKMIGNGGEELRIPTVQLKDSGEYRCIAQNSAGRDDKTTQVTVLAAPEIKRSTPSIMTVKENATVSIACRVINGFPKPAVTWWYMDTQSTEYVAIPNFNEGYLRLEHIQLSNAGHYKCVAQNSVGQADKDEQVIVEAPARIVFMSQNSSVYEGVEGDVVMRLPCTAVGYPKPTVSWIVDKVVVEKDKSKTLYVEDGVLYLKNPKESDSSIYSHTYVCHAVNELGKDRQSYEVYVSKYADYAYNQTENKYGEIKKPYDLNCLLLYTDPNSVRWFKNSIDMHKYGPSLHFDDPTEEDEGNFTCRVSDLNGAASDTVELKFGYPPSKPRLVYDEEWNGGKDEIICKVDQNLDNKYEWFYRGEKIKEAYAEELEFTFNGWGQYVCRVTNPLGSLNITYNIHDEKCIIERSLKMKKMPLVLDMSSAWPSFSKKQQYHIMPKSEKLTLICQDESPKNSSKSQSGSNTFMKFPKTKSIIATCDHEDLFLVDGVSYKFSELDCKEEVSSSVVPTRECLGSETMMMDVGFYVNGFLDVYKSCLDTKRNVVLYTEVIMTGADSFGYTNEPERTCQNKTDCCYESVQLVNVADVGAGPAEKATFREPLNTVLYCRPNDENTTSWHDIEKQVRRDSSGYRMIVWSGAVNYTTVDKLLVPQYLWKVVKDLETEEIVAIVHSNEQAPSANVCDSVCHESSWFESYGPRTYCCRLDEFKKVFNLPIKF